MTAPSDPGADPVETGCAFGFIGWAAVAMGALVVLSPLTGMPVIYRGAPLDWWETTRLGLAMTAGGGMLVLFGRWIRGPSQP
jgi:hypothetical protein